MRDECTAERADGIYDQKEIWNILQLFENTEFTKE